MAFKFEEFNGKRQRSKDIPMVTITKAGNINFNLRFQQDFLDSYRIVVNEYVIFLYDNSNKVIGLKITSTFRKNSYPIRHISKNAATVSARAFLKHYNIPFDKTRTYIVDHDKDKDLITIDLNKK